MARSIIKNMIFLVFWVFTTTSYGSGRVMGPNRSERDLVLVYDCSSSALNTPFLKILSNGENNVLFLAGENNLGRRIITQLLKVEENKLDKKDSPAAPENSLLVYRNGAILLTIVKQQSLIELEDGLGNIYSCSQTPFYRFQWGGFSMTSGASFIQHMHVQNELE